MSEPARPTHHHTVEEYLALEETASVRHEYVGGSIFAMVGTTKRHNRIVFNIAQDRRWIEHHFRGEDGEWQHEILAAGSIPLRCPPNDILALDEVHRSIEFTPSYQSRSTNVYRFLPVAIKLKFLQRDS